MMHSKRISWLIVLLALTSVLQANVPADRHPSVKASRAEYYWVVETGSQEGLPYSIVRFYKGHRLVDTRLMQGSQLDASRASVQRKLNKALKKMIIFEEVAQK